MKRIDLHIHLDGSMPAETVLKLAKMSAVDLPEKDIQGITTRLTVNPDCTSLNEYLEKFDVPISVLQTAECLEMAVYDVLAHLAKQNIAYVELRYAPGLHLRRGLTQNQVVEATIAGLNRAMRDYPIMAQLILCCMRGADAEVNRTTIDMVKTYLGKGVCCADLAGAEALFSTESHRELFAYAKEQNVPFIIHAGEADGPKSIWDALSMGAVRIGHGIAAVQDRELMDYLRDHQIPLEVCVTSNVQTKGVPSLKEHPIVKMLEYGIPVTVNTDNMTVSGTDIEKEFSLLKCALHLTNAQEQKLTENSIHAAFLSDEEKRLLHKAIFG